MATKSLETNPIFQAIKDQIKELLWEDLSKSEIRETLSNAFPNITEDLFNSLFSQTYTTLIGA